MLTGLKRLLSLVTGAWSDASVTRRVAIGVVAALLIGAVVMFSSSSDRHAVAYFNDSTGIYVGDSVDVLGVPVGAIDKIVPQSDGVRIEFHYKDSVKIPADAKAVIVAPSLVSGRFLQLTPQYATGPVLAEGAIIPLKDTATPVEWDQIKGELDQLAVGLGPKGVNKDGSLSHFVSTTSVALKGQGPAINQTLADLAAAMSTISGGQGDLFGTVKNLSSFVNAMRESDGQIQAFTANLAGVSQVLSNDRSGLKQILADLASTTDKVRGFIRTNHTALTTTLDKTGSLMAILQSNEAGLAQTLHTAPQAINDLLRAYNSSNNSVGANLDIANVTNAAELVCGAIGAVGLLNPTATYAACSQALGPVLGLLSGGPNGGILGTLTGAGGVKLP